jgi:hypothetical protein
MDTEDGQIFIRVQNTHPVVQSRTDTRAELGLLCTDTRKSACECAPATTAGLQSWPEHRCLSLIAHRPCQSSCLIFLERLGSSAVSAVADVHFASDQTCKAHADTASSLLPTLTI